MSWPELTMEHLVTGRLAQAVQVQAVHLCSHLTQGPSHPGLIQGQASHGRMAPERSLLPDKVCSTATAPHCQSGESAFS